MAEVTKISWCHGTFNPWQGCVKVSPACMHCYAERDTKRFGRVIWGSNGTRVLTSDAYWKKPLKWDREAAASGERKRVFCASFADVFEDWSGQVTSNTIPVWKCNCGNWFDAETQETPCDKCGDLRTSMVTLQDCRKRLFRLIDQTPNLDWLLLTKRPENIEEMWPCKKDTDGDGNCNICIRASNALCRHRANVWLGTSVENQEYADKRIPELLKCRDLSPVLFLSCEPLLGPVDLMEIQEKSESGDLFFSAMGTGHPSGATINWVIAGGESGFNARPSNADWLRSLRDQCAENDVPYHFKQWGEFDQYGIKVGKAAAGNVLDGRLHQEFPKVVGL
jgi:protein gp37